MPSAQTAAPPSEIAVGDLAVRRVTSLVRVAAALLITALASIETMPLPAALTWAAGLVWLPLVAWLWFAEEGPASVARTRVGHALDLAVLGVFMVRFPENAATIVVLAVPITALAAYRSGTLTGLGFGGVVLALRGLAVPLTGVGWTDPLDEVGTAVALVAVIVLIDRARRVQQRDARQVQRSAHKSDVLLATSSEGIVVTNHLGTVVQTNPAADRILGAAPGELVGHGCATALGLRDANGPLDCARGCALTQLSDDDQGVEVWRQVGGQRQPLLASASLIPGEPGAAQHVHSLRDITRLRQADEAKTMFLATTSHELKTPLTVIRGFAQVLKATANDPQSKIALNAIETRSQELAAIVDRLLLSSRIEAGRVDLTVESVDLSGMLRDRLIGIGTSIGRTIDVDVADDLTAHVSADGLATALDHLLDNAAKYSPGGAPIVVRAHGGDDRVRIEVVDHGIGMTAAQASQCFERFWQAEATDVRRFGGTGIGLYIVHSLITTMGGEIAVESRLGEGTTFTIDLPVEAGEPAPAGGPARRGDETSVGEFMHQLGLPTGAPK